MICNHKVSFIQARDHRRNQGGLSARNGLLRVQGARACSGCPSSSATLKAGVEQMMRHYVPEVTRVEQTL